MNIKPTVNFIQADVNWRIVTLQDTTEYPIDKNLIAKLAVTVNMDSAIDVTLPRATQIFEGEQVREIVDGAYFEINSKSLGITPQGQAYVSFKEGVIDVDYYVCTAPITGTGKKGDTWVFTDDSTVITQECDSVIVGNQIYPIDKTKPNSSGEVLYITRELVEDVVQFNPAYRANLKIKNSIRSKMILAKSAGILTQNSTRNRVLDREQGILKVIHNLRASEIGWELEDYISVERLLKENVFIGEKLGLLEWC